jgi:hypothetical protein
MGSNVLYKNVVRSRQTSVASGDDHNSGEWAPRAASSSASVVRQKNVKMPQFLEQLIKRHDEHVIQVVAEHL